MENDKETLEKIRAIYEDKEVRVYLSNGKILSGTAKFLNGFINVEKQGVGTSLCNMDYIISISID